MTPRISRPRAPGRALQWLAFALSTSSAYACYSSTESASPGDTTDAGGTDGGSSSPDAGRDGSVRAPVTPGDAASGQPPPVLATSDLPCSIDALLVTSCQRCHGSTPTNGAPMSLVTHADLAAPAPSDASKTVAASALIRIQATDSTVMPPAPAAALSPDDIATFVTYVVSGFPVGSCTTDAGAPPDAGAGADAGPPMVVCTSGGTWTGGDHGSAVMHPGEACIACHTTDDGPKFAAAGTVFPTLHEPDDCNGSNLSGLATIKIIDSRNVETDIPIDTVGNFHAYADQVTITPPFNATVVDGARTRAMTEHQTVGDCNTCHTVLGANGAPGRIMAP